MDTPKEVNLNLFTKDTLPGTKYLSLYSANTI